jgi:hypothetical protein
MFIDTKLQVDAGTHNSLITLMTLFSTREMGISAHSSSGNQYARGRLPTCRGWRVEILFTQLEMKSVGRERKSH